MTGGLAIARLFGIEIRISPAWILAVAMVTIIGAQQSILGAPTLSPIVHWAIGLVVSLMFLASVVGHEVAHALVGRRRGVPVTTLSLGFIGGQAPLAIQAPRPRDELVIAIAGPGVSLGLGLALVVLGVLMDAVAPSLTPVAGGLAVAGVLNLILGGLSLVPAMPLDGGRLVRAIAWARTGNRDLANRATARVGRVVGWTIIGAGVALVLADIVTEGLVALALGWLLTSGARTVERRLALEQLLRGVSVSDAMDRDVPFVAPNLTVDTFAGRFEGPEGVTAMPVVDDDRVVGVLGRRRLARLGWRRFGNTRVSDVMAVPPQAPVLAPSDALWDAMELLTQGGFDGLAVADDGRLAGLVTRDGLATSIRALAARQATGG